MKVKQLLKRSRLSEIKGMGLSMGLSMGELNHVVNVWEQLRGLEARKSEAIEVHMDVDGFYELEEEMMHVYGKTKEEEEIDLSFYDWKEWLDFEVDKDLVYFLSAPQVVIHLLQEMKTWGTNRESVLQATGTESSVGVVRSEPQTVNNVVYLFQ